jgi:ABC-type antimicrobial peptide transport system permease subunit
MSNALIYIGIAVGVAAMAAAIAYGTENQKNYVPEDAVLSQAAEQGLLPKTGALGADLNKEQWHEDPFGDMAAKIKAENGR